MKRALFLGGGLLALTSTIALAQPESLLPDIFDDPPPETTNAPAAPTAPPVDRPGNPAPVTPGDASPSAPVLDPVPGYVIPGPVELVPLPEDFPTLEELEEMEEFEINELFGLRPKFDVPPVARRAVSRIGVISSAEGGFPAGSLARQPGALVRAALEGTRGPLVSRWGHILLRRTLASRLDAPEGMEAVEFAALRAQVLNHMGEGHVARSIVQDIDTGNYDRALTDAAFDAYLSTGDLLGMCPAAILRPDLREDGHWILTQAICNAYLGDQRGAARRLDRALGTGEAEEIDVRLAQRYAGAAGQGSRAVTLEWDSVEELTPWRFSLVSALGAQMPENLRSAAPADFDLAEATIPAVPLPRRAAASRLAGERGILSSAAMVDLYSQLYASDVVTAGDQVPGRVLREAYVAEDPSARLAAMRELWAGESRYGAMVLTAYAAARMPVSEAYEDDAADLIASMLAAGLDRNAMRWGSIVREGSGAWGILAVAQPSRANPVSRGALDSYVYDDDSVEQRKSQFLLAGLAGLGRLEGDVVADFSDRLEVDLQRASPWSRRIGVAAEYGNPALVSLLAGLGMQGNSWDRMTPRHLYHIVRALDAVGLNAEARMIAAEAVARG